MADVDFNEPQYASAGRGGSQKSSFFSRTIIGWGLAKDNAGAQRVMGIVALIAAALALAVYFFS